jgi:hypothetical protein
MLRPPKVKLSISVDSQVLERSMKSWGGKISQLVESLLADYSKRSGNAQ